MNSSMTPEDTIARLREQLQYEKKKAEPYRELYLAIATLLPRSTNGLPDVSQVHNASERYVRMGVHFETLMDAINKHETLKYKWDDLILLLKLTEGHDEED